MKRYGFLITVTALSLLPCLAACSVPIKKEGGELSGRELYYEKCSFCHRPFPPESRGADEWVDILDTMGPRAGLSPAEMEMILNFLVKEPGG